MNMSDSAPKPTRKPKVTEVEPVIQLSPQPVDQPSLAPKQPLPGYEQICTVCPFKDFYMEFKRVVSMGDELNHRASIIDLLAKKLEELNKS